MRSPIRVAVVGLGDIGRFVAGFLRVDPGFVPQIVVDLDATRAKAGASRFRFREWSTDYDRALASAEVDAVYLGVPHHLHHSMILRSIEAGKPVLCEKPIATTVPHALEIATESRLRAVPVAINYQYRFDPAAARMIQAVRCGSLGAIHSIRCLVPWHRETPYFARSPWHASLASSGGGTLLTQGSHAIDLALQAVAAAPKQAVCRTANHCFPDVEVEDSAYAMITCENGTTIDVISTMCASPERPLQVEVYGDAGTAHYRGAGARRLRLRAPSPPPAPTIPRGLHPLHRSMRAFRDWLITGVPSAHTAESTIPVLRAIIACYDSAQAGSAPAFC